VHSILNREVNNAFLRAYKRSEGADDAALTDTYVSIPSLESMLRTPQHQVVYGRRGTGKTHILKYLAHTKRNEGDAAIYIDLRTIGSAAGIYGDTSLPFPSRATTLLIDVVEAIHTSIYDLTLSDATYANLLHEIGPKLDALANASTQVKVTGDVETETIRAASTEHSGERSAGIEVTPAGPKVSASARGSRTHNQRSEARRTERGPERVHVTFGQLSAALRALVETLPKRELWIMLDEWSSLPLDLQPFLADLLRRNAFTAAGVTVKIGAIERRSRFIQQGVQGDYIGIELGADTSASIDIDDYLSFEDDRAEVQDFFGALLFKHVVHLMTEEGGRGSAFPSAREFILTAFAEGLAFPRLCFFSEGVPRDALQIAALAASRAADSPITVSDVNRSNRDYFRRDKENRLSPAANDALNEIIELCVENDRRVIALRRPEQTTREVVQELYDFRLLHRRAQRTSLPDRPISEKYDLFMVDLGCFEDLLQNGKVRLVDEGGRAPGIVRAARREDMNSPSRRSSAVLIPSADHWA
jgi:hypothetical protein